MSRHDPELALADMRDAAREAMDLAKGLDKDALRKNRVVQLAVVRLLEVLGEAATRVPDQVRQRFSDVPWTQIVGLRNRLIHGYDVVDLGVVAKVVNEELDRLLAALEA